LRGINVSEQKWKNHLMLPFWGDARGLHPRQGDLQDTIDFREYDRTDAKRCRHLGP
jgi:hypothetical protein